MTIPNVCSYPSASFLLASAILLAILTPSYAQEINNDVNSSTITKDGLELFVSTDKKIYNEGEVVYISWKVTNIGSEDIHYIKTSSCGDGFKFRIFDSTLHDLKGLLIENVLLIPKNDPNLSKFGSIQFYGDILHLAKTEPTRQINVIIFTPDIIELEKILKYEYEIDKITKAEKLSFVSTRLNVNDILKIASSDLVKSITNAEGGVCTTAESTDILKPNQTIENSYNWSQLVWIRGSTESFQRAASGYYSIDVLFNDSIANCVTIKLTGNDLFSPQDKIPCGLFRVPSGTTKEQIINIYRQTFSIHPELKGIYGQVLESITVQEPIKISTQIINNDQKTEIPFLYQFTIRDSSGQPVGGTEAIFDILDPNQVLTPSFTWIPQVAGTYTVEIRVGNSTENLFPIKSFDITVQEDQQVQVIPLWIKQNAKWWSANQTKDSEFIDAISYLVEKDLIVVGNASGSEIIDESDQRIPSWVRKNAEWWANDLISDDDFMKGIEYLLKVRIIRITDS